MEYLFKRKMHLFLIFIISIIVFAGCAQHSPQPTPLPENTVLMMNDSFVPQTITVAPGTRITWVNMDTEVHSVTCEMPSEMQGVFFDSGAIQPGRTYERTFVNIGQFHYRCKFQPLGEMTGIVIVQ